MSSLESILIKYKGKSFTVFNDKGRFTKEGYLAYCNFCSILHELGSIVDSFNAEQVEQELDKIAEFAN